MFTFCRFTAYECSSISIIMSWSTFIIDQYALDKPVASSMLVHYIKSRFFNIFDPVYIYILTCACDMS